MNNKLDRFIARYALGWTFCMHSAADTRVLVSPDKIYEFAKHDDLPHFSSNDDDAFSAIYYLLNKDKALRLTLKLGYVDKINSLYYSIILKKVVNNELILYNGSAKTAHEAITECLIKYSNRKDWQQLLDGA